jgi:zinc/manganese transport system substrate-binding protein
MERTLRLVHAIALYLTLTVTAVAAPLEVVATSSSGGLLAREIAGGHARITVLGPPDRDLHYLQARPSMMQALRRADLLIVVGADLEVGWLPVAIRQAANPDIQPGRKGYFEFAAHIDLLDVGGVADRALGDVHPLGNPHVHMDPVRMATIASSLAERFAERDAEHASHYRDHATAFANAIAERLPAWRRRAEGAAGAVLFHQDANYLFYRFGVPIHGFLEPVAGVPPTAAHIKGLVDRLEGKRGVVLHTTFQPEQAPLALARALGWPVVRLPLEPPLESNGSDYVEHIDRWIEAMVDAR